MNIKKLMKNKKGFTLIEIIVVVVILAVLMAVAVPSVLKYMGEADNAKYMSTARGAFISSQTELAKAQASAAGIVADDLDTGKDGALKKAMEEVNKSETGKKTLIKDIDVAGLAAGGDVSTVTTYTIIFTGGEKAVLTPNGDVVITAAP